MQGDLVVYKEVVSCEELACDDQEVQNDTAFVIYGALQVNHLRDPFKRHQSLLNKLEESANVGCTGVLQICDEMESDFKCADSSSSDESNKAVKKSQPWKKMVKWAPPSATKGWKDYDEVNNSSSSTTSSRVSFKRDTSSCLNSSLMYSDPLASTSRFHNIPGLTVSQQSSKLDPNPLGYAKSQTCISRGRWITTDSEYFVLEL